MKRVGRSNKRAKHQHEASKAATSTSGAATPAASTRALMLAELVSNVLSNVYAAYVHSANSSQPDRSIFSCMMVDTLWAEEARRLIWRRCQSVDGLKYFPQIHHLAKAGVTDRQPFVNRIRELNFGFGSNMSCQWSGEHHSSFQFTTFPRLEKLVLSAPRPTRNFAWKNPPIVQYLVPTLKELQFVQLPGYRDWLDITNDMLLAIAERCTSLQKLCFKIVPTMHTRHLSPEMFASCLKKMHSLTTLELDSGTASLISHNLGRALAYHESLKFLSLPSHTTIGDELISNLVKTKPAGTGIFRNLQKLRICTSMKGLERLLPHLTSLRMLEAKPSDSTEELLESFGGLHLPNIEELLFDLSSWNSFGAQALLELVKSTPNLQMLEIPNVSTAGGTPTTDLNDTMVEEIAQYLPRIRKLRLMGSRPRITEASVVSLGKHCPDLEHLGLTGIMNFEGLAASAKEGSWPELKSFDLKLMAKGRFIDSLKCKRPVTIARALLSSMPKLERPPYPANASLKRALKRFALEQGRKWKDS